MFSLFACLVAEKIGGNEKGNISNKKSSIFICFMLLGYQHKWQKIILLLFILPNLSEHKWKQLEFTLVPDLEKDRKRNINKKKISQTRFRVLYSFFDFLFEFLMSTLRWNRGFSQHTQRLRVTLEKKKKKFSTVFFVFLKGRGQERK